MRRSTLMRSATGVEALLTSSAGVSRVVRYPRASIIFAQGDRCEGVMYLRSGRAILTVMSDAGRQAVVATLGPGEFLGESCLAGQTTRTTTATTAAPSSIRVIETAAMRRLLQCEPKLAAHFTTHILNRNVCIEQDLLDHLFDIDSTEEHLARLPWHPASSSATPFHARRRTLPHAGLTSLIAARRARVVALMQQFQQLGLAAPATRRPTSRRTPQQRS